jgi:outer membrane protein assembly factor BamA
MLNGNFVHSNFMGRGERVAMEVNAGKYSSVYSLAHTDPATTIDGIARTVSLAYIKTTQFVSQASQFSTTRRDGGLGIRYSDLRVSGSALWRVGLEQRVVGV